jgi:hypothetical protein
MSAQRRSTAAQAGTEAAWLYRPHLPSPPYPSGLAGILIVTEAGKDRFFDVVSDGPIYRDDAPIIINGWRVWERRRGAPVMRICYRPGAEVDAGWPHTALLRAALEKADLPLFAPPPSPWRSTGDFAANDPAAYERHMEVLTDIEWPGK